MSKINPSTAKWRVINGCLEIWKWTDILYAGTASGEERGESAGRNQVRVTQLKQSTAHPLRSSLPPTNSFLDDVRTYCAAKKSPFKSECLKNMFKFLDDFILNFHLRKIQKYSKGKERGTAAKLWIYSHKKSHGEIYSRRCCYLFI